jgi:hypothetical protein
MSELNVALCAAKVGPVAFWAYIKRRTRSLPVPLGGIQAIRLHKRPGSTKVSDDRFQLGQKGSKSALWAAGGPSAIVGCPVRIDGSVGESSSQEGGRADEVERPCGRLRYAHLVKMAY